MKLMRYIVILCIAAMLSSCGTAHKAEGNQPQTDVEIQQDTVEKKDSFVPLHPPVVIPHSWNEA